MNKYIRSVCLLLLSNIALGGGWIVGGGEIIEDATNPWFLNNTPVVRYCVLIDEVNFGLTQSQAEQSIENGIKFWKRQYETTTEYSVEIPVLNGQKFIKEDCYNTTDLKFQFGHLNLEQMEKLNNINRKIAVAVRTHYDKVNLRGKGFVYISPERGPLKLTNSSVISRPWSKSQGALLDLILIHELGHVFGQRHSNDDSIMDELFVERILRNEPDAMTKDVSEYIVNSLRMFSLKNSNNLTQFSCNSSENLEPIEIVPPNVPPNSPNQNGRSSLAKTISNVKLMESSNQNKLIQDFFGLDFKPGCTGITAGWKDNKYFVSIAFYDISNNSREYTIYQEPYSFFRLDTDSVLKLFLTKEQKVYEQQKNTEYVMFGVKENLVVFKSHFVNESKGIKRPVVISYSPSGGAKITAEFQGTVYLNIFDGI